jgi:hypothetical protein
MEMTMLNDKDLLMTFDCVAVLENGTRQPTEIDITVGQVRQYIANPHPCQCDTCKRVFPVATKLLRAQEDFLAGKITWKQLDRKLKRMGYANKGKIQGH